MVNLGYSDHFAHILCFLMNKQNDGMEKITRRIFSRRNIENLDIYWKMNHGERCIWLIAYMIYINYFEYAPLKCFSYNNILQEKAKKAEGIKVLCQRIRYLNNLKSNLTQLVKFLII